ncbi:MAG: hypothetical protein DVB31_16685 [Verrucomicrobia bacterium]|nr:MAG: hypothetical protein DVB31_16685 [Verrucomicrobiota bacterium]
MATNRRRDSETVQLGTLVRTILACAVISGLGVGYVRQRSAQHELGEQIKALERRRERAEQTLAIQRVTLSTLTSRPELLAKVRRFNLGLSNATPSQRLYVTLPAAPAPRDRAPAAPVPPRPAAPLPALAFRR